MLHRKELFVAESLPGAGARGEDGLLDATSTIGTQDRWEAALAVMA